MKPHETTAIDRALLMAFEAKEAHVHALEKELLERSKGYSEVWTRATNAEAELKAAVEKYERKLAEK